jgi:hypothetical protein
MAITYIAVRFYTAPDIAIGLQIAVPQNDELLSSKNIIKTLLMLKQRK